MSTKLYRYGQAVALVIGVDKASTSFIQRKLAIGYNEAAGYIEKMEREGIVGPANHVGRRLVLRDVVPPILPEDAQP